MLLVRLTSNFPVTKSLSMSTSMMAGLSKTSDTPTQPAPQSERLTQAIITTLATMKSDGKNEHYITCVKYTLKYLSKNINIFDSEQVKTFIADSKTKQGTATSAGTKNKWIDNYDKFCEANQIPFDKPHYYYQAPIPIIPKTSDVQAIIAASPRDIATVFTIQAEIGTEGEELAKTPRTQINSEQGIISIIGIKKHDNGTYKLKDTTAELRQYLAKHTKTYPFPSSRVMSKSWQRTKKKVAKKLCRQEILEIKFKNLRNYAGAIFYLTMGKDPIQTKNFMRHKKLETTMDYLRGLTEFSANATFISKVATTAEEAIELLNQGFKEQSIFGEKHIFTKLKY